MNIKKNYITTLLLIMISPIAIAQLTANFSSSEEVHQQKVKARSDAQDHFYAELVGKTFWYKPGNFKSPFHEFYLNTTVNSDGVVKYNKQIFPTSLIKFEIISSSQLGKTYTGHLEYTYKIRFEDNTEAFMKGTSFGIFIGSDKHYSFHETSVSISVMDAKNDRETYIFAEDPAVIISREDQKKLDATERIEREKSNRMAAEAKAEANRIKTEKMNAKKGGVRLGMSKNRVLSSSWGEPDHVNRTVSHGGTREQWVYGSDSYLYFDNGILTTIQN